MIRMGSRTLTRQWSQSASLSTSSGALQPKQLTRTLAKRMMPPEARLGVIMLMLRV